MDRDAISQLLQQVASGALSVDAALERLRDLPFENLGFAHVDHHRALRTGHPEVIFCLGKATEHVLAIAEKMLARGSRVLATRVSAEQSEVLARRFAAPNYCAELDRVARTAVIRPADTSPPQLCGQVLVVAAGTSDLPVAQEAVVTARAMGARTDVLIDVGVAGIHRLLAYRQQLHAARALVVVAGMEGALASVVGGLVDAPVIAVPTSVGYGASFGGLAALLTMLNSCASGVVVVNIDNGFGAGHAAALINSMDRAEPT